MATFKPEVNYKNLERYGANCRACEVKLTSENFGEKINDERGYAPANSFYLAKWGMFCNPCSIEVCKAEEDLYKNNFKKIVT